MTITRVGSNEDYAANFETAFGKKPKSKSAGKKTGTKKATAKASAKKKTARKKS